MSASPLFRLTFDDGTLTHLRGNEAVWRLNALSGRLHSLLVRDVRPGDRVRVYPRDPADPERLVVGVERLPPRLAGGGGRERAD
jgi:hypothetical protein